MSKIQITGIRKPGGAYNHHSAITDYRWQDQSGQIGISTRMEVVNWLMEDQSQNAAYVIDRRGDVAYCRVMRSQYGTLFLETRPDGILADNLLSLPLI